MVVQSHQLRRTYDCRGLILLNRDPVPHLFSPGEVSGKDRGLERDRSFLPHTKRVLEDPWQPREVEAGSAFPGRRLKFRDFKLLIQGHANNGGGKERRIHICGTPNHKLKLVPLTLSTELGKTNCWSPTLTN